MTVSLYQKNIWIYFFPSGQGNESYILIGSKRGPDFLSLTMVTVTLALIFFSEFFFSFESLEKNKQVIYRLRVGPYSEKLQTLSQFFTIRTSQPANNVYLFQSVAEEIRKPYSTSWGWRNGPITRLGIKKNAFGIQWFNESCYKNTKGGEGMQ